MCPREPGKIEIIIRCLFIITCALTTTFAAEENRHETELELLKAQVELLKSKIGDLAQGENHDARKILDLQQSLMKLESEQDVTPLYFDCYRTESLSTVGTITFNGCTVDTTTIDPWSGLFTIPTPGIYRVAIQVVSNLPLTPKQRLHLSICSLY